VARFRHSTIVWWVEPGERWRPPYVLPHRVLTSPNAATPLLPSGSS
jgi:hypothetical protein